MRVTFLSIGRCGDFNGQSLVLEDRGADLLDFSIHIDLQKFFIHQVAIGQLELGPQLLDFA